jgi:hypothetical protein
MAGSRPSIQSVQTRFLIVALGALILGCLFGSIFGLYYAWKLAPATYTSGAYPGELAPGYQSHYLAMVVDSYIVNKQVGEAQKRLQTFDQATKIRVLAERSMAFQVNGQGVEAQAVNELAAQLKQIENWPPEAISAQVGKLATENQADPAKVQAITTYGSALNVVMQQPGQTGQPAQPAAQSGQPVATTPPAPPAEAGSTDWGRLLLYCALGLGVLVVIVLLIGSWYFKHSRKVKPQAAWEGEGPAPIKQWNGTYTLGQDNYDEFFVIETPEGVFLGESGMGILEAVPGTKPKQVQAFDVGLFDKTDITTLSRVLMSEHAYYDEAIQAKVQANPQAEAILAKPGAEFVLETSALRVVAKVEDLEYGEGNIYFNKLKLSLDVFVREGADLRIGSMDTPEQYSQYK